MSYERERARHWLKASLKGLSFLIAVAVAVMFWPVTPKSIDLAFPEAAVGDELNGWPYSTFASWETAEEVVVTEHFSYGDEGDWREVTTVIQHPADQSRCAAVTELAPEGEGRGSATVFTGPERRYGINLGTGEVVWFHEGAAGHLFPLAAPGHPCDLHHALASTMSYHDGVATMVDNDTYGGVWKHRNLDSLLGAADTTYLGATHLTLLLLTLFDIPDIEQFTERLGQLDVTRNDDGHVTELAADKADYRITFEYRDTSTEPVDVSVFDDIDEPDYGPSTGDVTLDDVRS